jgi:1-acyl-sn-glycerol-3-phosphate acyltransferase
MRYARATFRLIALGGVMAGYYLRWLLGAPFVFAFNSCARDWRNLNFRGWALTSVRVMHLTINVRNQPPTGPFLMVSNHLSYVDIIVLGSQANCAFVAKSEVANWPIIGLICRTMDTIFIDRKSRKDIRRVMQRIDETLRRGLGVVLFAEGTSTNGQSVLPFKTSLLDFAARNHLPVHYASVGYVAPPGEHSADQSVCWWGDMTLPGHLFRLLQLPSFEASLVYGSEPVVADDRRVLAAKLWSAVSSELNSSSPRSQRPSANRAEEGSLADPGRAATQA